MRISDWSSYVCSSDLSDHHQRRGPDRDDRRGGRDRRLGLYHLAAHQERLPARWRLGAGHLSEDQRRGDGARQADQPGKRPAPRRTGIGQGDRKSGVRGKSVSLRVNLGGRRIIKKKKNKKKE